MDESADRSIVPSLGGLGTGVGSLPHLDAAEASRIVCGEVPDFPFLPELPGRGPHAGIIGRGTAFLPEIDAELTTTGWRIGGGAGLEQRRAGEALSGDLDAFEAVVAAGAAAGGDVSGFRSRAVKTQVVGPLTLASGLELPGGRSVVADAAALWDIAQSLAEGVRSHLTQLRSRLGLPVVLQLDEPGLPGVLGGNIRRPSGLGRYPAVPAERASALLAEVLGAADTGDGPASGDPGGRAVRTVVHCCADTVVVAPLLDAGADAIGFDLSTVPVSRADEYAMVVEAGASLFVGAIPGVRPAPDPGDGTVPGRPDRPAGSPDGDGSRRSPASRILDWWRRLGFDEELAAARIVVTTACGSAGADEQWATHALGTVRDTARQLAT